MATIKKIGYGQVEPNHLSAQRTAQIYAQLPLDAATKTAINGVLENGMFVKYDLANKAINLTGKGEWMLVFNEIKLYDERKQMYRDYAMLEKECVNGEMVPRVFKTNIGDIYTTNTLLGADGDGATLVVGDVLVVDDATGLLKKGSSSDTEFVWEVAKVYTLADGQDAVKIVRIK